MERFCMKCGAKIGDSKFCPNCGAESAPAANSHTATKTDGLSKYIPLLFPVLYIVLMLFNWFKLSVPLLGEREYHIYTLYSGLNNVFSYTDGGFSEFIAKAFAVILLIIAVIIVFTSVKACVLLVKNNKDYTASIASASILSIIESVLAITAVLILKYVIKSEFSEIGFDQIVSNMFGFTKAPVFLIIFGIIGKVVSNKIVYARWKNEIKENDIMDRIIEDDKK